MNTEIKFLQGIVEEKTGVSLEVSTRKREYVYARRIYYSIIKKRFNKMSLDAIGETLSLKQDHSTVLYHVRECEYDYKLNADFRKMYNSIQDRFYGLAGEPEVDLEEENMKLRFEVQDLQNKIKSLKDKILTLKEEIKKERSNNIRPRNQQTTVYYASEGISDSIF